MRIVLKLFAGLLLIFLLLVVCWNWRPASVPVVAVQGPMPAGFIWGVSSSAFQSEGGDVDSNWNRYNDRTPGQDRYGRSVDFRHRYRDDIELARTLGINTYRIGISWARIEPKKGQYDETELAYYDDLILALKQAGIAPLITLDHFTYPGWVLEQGAWSNPQTTADFVAYTRLIAQRYHADVHLWITFNEAAFFMAGEAGARKLGLHGILDMRRNLIRAHRQAYGVIHALDAQARVTSNIVWMGDHLRDAPLRWLTDWMFLDAVEDKCDVIAIDYYASDVVAVLKVGKHWKWPPDPPGLYRALKMLKAQYPGKPLLIAETGMATENGKPREDGIKREDVLRDGVYWTQHAREDGVKVIGYMVWSLTDNFEWGSYTPRFGLYTVNALTDPTLARIPTAAVPAYQQIIRDGGVGADYRPVLAQ
ncbi:glycoside hydrolase family 1 protein [Solimonas terrae]|uniref:Glycoside hydrolase family 1 protein n=1 Tax=Solimonas terrae TaxID=1396819 RepID=A0A6M2BJI5_9GAMM|nr:family 1 glycosylhydrolase [Solimonas terrae]NGY03162.1 glycoside hydrolase family 1 protein [Solimonas terrae]